MTDRSFVPSSGEWRSCHVRGRTPVVLVAVRHPQLRRWTTELLDTACGCWKNVSNLDHELLVDAIARTAPDVVALDSLDFPTCCQNAVATLEPRQIVVIGPEPDPSYQRSALDNGAGGWVSQDHLGEDLVSAVWTALGCDCQPCPMGLLMTTDTDMTTRSTGEST